MNEPGAGPARGYTVLYDPDCPVCRRARRWAEEQHQLVPLHFLPAGSAAARNRFPDLDHATTLTDITTIGHDGGVRRGKHAWIIVLWAIAGTRTLANDLAAGRKQRAFSTVVGATEMIRKAAQSGPATCGPAKADTGATTATATATGAPWLPPGDRPEASGRHVEATNRDESR